MVNTRKPSAVAATASSLGGRLIATERDAAEAWGEGSEMHLWLREWLARPPPPPLVLTRAAGLAPLELGPAPAPLRVPFELLQLDGGGVLVPHGASLGVQPGPESVWIRLECDPRRDPPLRCSIDGEETPLEQVSPGVWRPASSAPTKAGG